MKVPQMCHESVTACAQTGPVFWSAGLIVLAFLFFLPHVRVRQRTRGDKTLQTKVGSAELYIKTFRGEPQGRFACNMSPRIMVEEL